MGWRSFLAVELTKEIEEKIAAVQEELKHRVDGVRWVSPYGTHLTLKFLGEIDPGVIDAITERTEAVVSGINMFTVWIGGGGGFPDLKRPRILWVGVEDSHGLLTKLQEELEKKLEGVGFQREKRVYHPHLTLGRVRSGRVGRLDAETLKVLESCEVGSLVVKEITLFRSHLKPTGAEYTKLRTVPLQIP